MIAFQLAFAFLRRRWGQALLSILVGALGIASAEAMLIASREIPAAAVRAFGGVDLVIGPKGSALDLVLCCVLHVSEPAGLVPLEAALQIAHHPLIRAAAPIALGDNVQGLRIVGTTPAMLSVYRATLTAGRVWDKPLEAVLGAEAAHLLRLKPGDHFTGAHGLGAGGEMHSQFPYTVTGILQPTGSTLDRLVLTDITTVFVIHKHHAAEEAEAQGLPAPPEMPPAATAVLASFRSPVALALLPRLVDASPQFSAASPAIESARLIRAARPVILVVLGLGTIFVIIAAATAATALLAGMSARARDLALLRALGAHPWEIAAIALAEAACMAIAAALLGLVLAYLLLRFGGAMLASHGGLLLDASPDFNDMVWIFGGAVLAALAAAAAPALRASRSPIETVLNA